MSGACLRRGIFAGVVGAVLGGAPSIVFVNAKDLDSSVQAISALMGPRRPESPWLRRLLGAAIHTSISVTFATIYACLVGRRPLRYAVAMWAVNYRMLAPEELVEEDRSLPLADHLCWGLVVGVVDRVLRGSWG